MKKRFRVKSNVDFQKIISAGKRVVGRYFIIYHDNAKMVTNDRIGISVGKKIGNAVERNLVKRQVRSMVLQAADFTRGKDIIIIVRGRYRDASYPECQKELIDLCERVYNE